MVGKIPPVFRDIADATAGNIMCLKPGDFLALEFDRTVWLNFTHDRLDGSRAANAIASQQADNFTLTNVKIDTLKNVALAVVAVQIAYLQHLFSFRFCSEVGFLNRQILADTVRRTGGDDFTID